MTRIHCIAISTIAATTAITPLHIIADNPEQVKNTNGTIDNKPLLKRIFKEFPTLYTDTAYVNENYIVVFRAALLNNKWHRHHSETKVAFPAESNSAGNAKISRDLQKSMVRFKTRN